MAVITIARQAGSGGDSICHRVADELGYGVVDRALVGIDQALIGDAALDRDGVDALAAQIVEELGAIVRAPGSVRETFDDARTYWNAKWNAQRYAAVLGSVIGKAAAGGCVAVLGQGGNFILEERPDVLRVFIGGSVPNRTRRLAAAERRSPELAEDLVRSSDAQRSLYIRRVFGREWTNPSGYDLVFARETSSERKTIASILRMARALDRAQLGLSTAGRRAAI